jgi:hypothetical protein
MTARSEAVRQELVERITEYLTLGGLFNPEMADHNAVRDLLIDCRAALALPEEEEWTDAEKMTPEEVAAFLAETGIDPDAALERLYKRIPALRPAPTPPQPTERCPGCAHAHMGGTHDPSWPGCSGKVPPQPDAVSPAPAERCGLNGCTGRLVVDPVAMNKGALMCEKCAPPEHPRPAERCPNCDDTKREPDGDVCEWCEEWVPKVGGSGAAGGGG